MSTQGAAVGCPCGCGPEAGERVHPSAGWTLQELQGAGTPKYWVLWTDTEGEVHGLMMEGCDNKDAVMSVFEDWLNGEGMREYEVNFAIVITGTAEELDVIEEHKLRVSL